MSMDADEVRKFLESREAQAHIPQEIRHALRMVNTYTERLESADTLDGTVDVKPVIHGLSRRLNALAAGPSVQLTTPTVPLNEEVPVRRYEPIQPN